MGVPTLMTKSVISTPFKISLELPTRDGMIKGFVTAYAWVKSRAEHRDLANRVASGDFADDDIAMLKEMYESIEGLGKDGKPVEDEDVWDFLEHDPLGSFIAPALITGYFEQFNKARVGNSGASSRR